MLRLAATLAVLVVAPVAWAAPPSYDANPDIYKVIFENEYQRVILSTWPPGIRDKEHSHPAGSVTYGLTDCNARLIDPDGTSRPSNLKLGSISATPVTQAHSLENLGTTECRALHVERK